MEAAAHQAVIYWMGHPGLLTLNFIQICAFAMVAFLFTTRVPQVTHHKVMFVATAIALGYGMFSLVWGFMFPTGERLFLQVLALAFLIVLGTMWDSRRLGKMDRYASVNIVYSYLAALILMPVIFTA